MIAQVKDFVRPHVKCIMYNDLKGDDEHLLRGEVLTMLRLMLGQLKLLYFIEDGMAPVVSALPFCLCLFCLLRLTQTRSYFSPYTVCVHGY